MTSIYHISIDEFRALAVGSYWTAFCQAYQSSSHQYRRVEIYLSQIQHRCKPKPKSENNVGVTYLKNQIITIGYDPADAIYPWLMVVRSKRSEDLVLDWVHTSRLSEPTDIIRLFPLGTL